VTRVKICGITTLKDARYAAACGADFLGFVFYPLSARFISPQNAKRIISKLPKNLRFVGVFVNEDPREVRRVVRYCGLDFVQLHGDESPGYLKKLKGLRVIRALRVKDRIPWNKLRAFGGATLLFDTFQKDLYGGTGKSFSWKVLLPLKKRRVKFFVSGGLTPENVAGLISEIRPFCVDVSSGVESAPGKKDHRSVKKFIEIVKRSHYGHQEVD
jgi:phosphoribosylanthranilate isomerase